MTRNQLFGAAFGAWFLVTLGLAMALDSRAVWPLSAGVALGAVVFVYARAEYVKELEGGER